MVFLDELASDYREQERFDRVLDTKKQKRQEVERIVMTRQASIKTSAPVKSEHQLQHEYEQRAIQAAQEALLQKQLADAQAKAKLEMTHQTTDFANSTEPASTEEEEKEQEPSQDQDDDKPYDHELYAKQPVDKVHEAFSLGGPNPDGTYQYAKHYRFTARYQPLLKVEGELNKLRKSRSSRVIVVHAKHANDNHDVTLNFDGSTSLWSERFTDRQPFLIKPLKLSEYVTELVPQADIHEWKKAGLIEIPEGGNAMREIIKRVDKNLEQHLHDDGMRVSASRSHANPGTFHGAGTVDEFAVGKSNCNKIDCSVCLRSATYGTIRNTTALANEIKALEQLTGATEPIRRAKLMLDALERE